MASSLISIIWRLKPGKLLGRIKNGETEYSLEGNPYHVSYLICLLVEWLARVPAHENESFRQFGKRQEA
jgi:hypothetical protein